MGEFKGGSRGGSVTKAWQKGVKMFEAIKERKTKTPEDVKGLAEQMLDEARRMVRHATRIGLRVPPHAVQVISECERALREGEESEGSGKSLRRLVRLHGTLAELVAPATPSSIRETDEAVDPVSSWRNVKFLRTMLSLSGIALVVYVALLAVEQVVELGHWGPVLFQVMLIAAAGLGASFHALFLANRHIVDRTFDPKYNNSYYIRFVLGLIAGPILANLIFCDGGIGEMRADAGGGSLVHLLAPTSVSLLGGYSADAVNRILNRLVEAIVTLVRGETSDIVRAKEMEMKATQTRSRLEMRRRIASKIIDMKRRVGDEEAGRMLDRLLDEVIEEGDE